MNLYIHQITPNDLVLVKGYKKPIRDPSCAIYFESGAYGHACVCFDFYIENMCVYIYMYIHIKQLSYHAKSKKDYSK